MAVVVVASEVDQQKAAPLGLFVLVLLGVACYFLFKSMSRHLRHVRDDFPVGGFGSNEGAGPVEAISADDITSAEGLTRPAPVTMTRGSATEPRLIEPRAVGPRVIEPGVNQPRIIEGGVTGPDLNAPETGTSRDPEASH